MTINTYSLAQAGFHYQNPQELLMWGLAIFTFHLFAPAVQIWVKKMEHDLLFDSYMIFLKVNLLAKHGLPTLWRRKDQKESFTACLGIDAEGYLGSILFVGLDVFSFVLSLVLGFVVLVATC